MKTKFFHLMLLALGLTLCLSACAGRQKPVVFEGMGPHVVNVNVVDYRFVPDTFQTPQGSTIVFGLHNLSTKDHNFTIKDPDGKTVQDVDVMADKSVEARVLFSRPGTYSFYCNKDLHREQGMTGKVIVIGR